MIIVADSAFDTHTQKNKKQPKNMKKKYTNKKQWNIFCPMMTTFAWVGPSKSQTAVVQGPGGLGMQDSFWGIKKK